MSEQITIPGGPALVLLNGAPGSGKSTLAALLTAQLADERPGALALDIDAIKHSLGGWEEDLTASGLQARRLAVAMAARHLRDGHDVVVGQYLARTAFLEELEQLADDCGARFVEVVLVLDEATLRRRLTDRRARPDRPEQAANDRHVGPTNAPDLVGSIAELLPHRPHAHLLEASGSREELLERLGELVGATQSR